MSLFNWGDVTSAVYWAGSGCWCLWKAGCHEVWSITLWSEWKEFYWAQRRYSAFVL